MQIKSQNKTTGYNRYNPKETVHKNCEEFTDITGITVGFATQGISIQYAYKSS